MQLTLFLKLIRASMIMLYGTELATVSLLTYNLFDVCLLSISLLLTFFIMQAVQLICEAFDELFGLKGFVRLHHRQLLLLKVLMVTTIVAVVIIYHFRHGGRLEQLGAELWVVGVSEVIVLVLILIKDHIQRQHKKQNK